MAEFNLTIPSYVKTVLGVLYKNGYEGYLVGGCVRDSLMGNTPHDYDIATNALPEETAQCFGDFHVIYTGLKHGTVSVVSEGQCIEITTYRIDGEYKDNRRPESVEFTRNIYEDLARRDFTVNAIAYSPKDGFVDLFGGGEDIKNKIIKCVGNPDNRFNEDGLRILRALRFSSVLGFSTEEETARSIHKNAELLKNISAERIYSELCRLVCGKNAAEVCMDYRDVLFTVIPELKRCDGFEQNSRYHCYDVYTHMVKTLENVPAEPVTRFAAFFHDIGKPDCYSEDENGGHFYGHNKAGAELARTVMRRLKADKNTVNTVAELVYMHDAQINTTEKAVRRLMSKTEEKNIYRLLHIKNADRRAHAPEYSDCGAYTDEIIRIMEKIKNDDACLSLKSLRINGNDIAELGAERGPEIGRILNALLDRVLDGETENERECLTAEAKKMIDEGKSRFLGQ